MQLSSSWSHCHKVASGWALRIMKIWSLNFPPFSFNFPPLFQRTMFFTFPISRLTFRTLQSPTKFETLPNYRLRLTSIITSLSEHQTTRISLKVLTDSNNFHSTPWTPLAFERRDFSAMSRGKSKENCSFQALRLCECEIRRFVEAFVIKWTQTQPRVRASAHIESSTRIISWMDYSLLPIDRTLFLYF